MKAVAIAIVLGVVLAACESVFDPIVPSDLHFSLHGFLDASADTQWVRVEPVARTVAVDPGLLDVSVTLDDLRDGGTVAMAQQVRTFDTGPAHLFWTTADIALGGRYRLRVRGADGAETTAEVEIPAEESFEVAVESGEFVCPTAVTVSGAEHVADVQARYTVVEDGRTFEVRFSHVETLTALSDGATRAAIYAGDDVEAMAIGPTARIVRYEVLVAVSTAAWPDMLGVTLESALQAQNPTLTGGVGFVGGVVTRRLPFLPGTITTGPFSGGPCVAS